MPASVILEPLRHVAHRLGALLSSVRRAGPGVAEARPPARPGAASMRVNPFFDLFLDPPTAADEPAR